MIFNVIFSLERSLALSVCIYVDFFIFIGEGWNLSFDKEFLFNFLITKYFWVTLKKLLNFWIIYLKKLKKHLKIYNFIAFFSHLNV